MRRGFALLLSALALGCGDESETETEPEPEPEPEPPATVSYSACVKYGGTGAPASGVLWAVVDRPELPTAETGSDGCVVLAGLPPNEELLLSWTKNGDLPRLRPVRTGTSDFENLDVEYQLPIDEAQRILDWAPSRWARTT